RSSGERREASSGAGSGGACAIAACAAAVSARALQRRAARSSFVGIIERQRRNARRASVVEADVFTWRGLGGREAERDSPLQRRRKAFAGHARGKSIRVHYFADLQPDR